MTKRRDASGTAALVLSLVLCAAAWPPSKSCAPDSASATCRGAWVEALAANDVSTWVVCAAGSEQARPVRGPARLLVGLPIELNRASIATLEVLPGIGPGRAVAIATARCRAPFRDRADIQRVPGIGPRTAEGLRGWAVAGALAPDRCGPSTLLP